MKLNKALILAAGKGTRFLPYTKACPKEMLAVVDKPALQLLVEEVAQAGIRDVLIVISPDKQQIVKYFTADTQYIDELISCGKNQEAESLRALQNLAEVKFVYQNQVDGTGKAVMLAREWANDEPFVVLNGDDVILSEKSVTLQLTEAFETCHKTIVGVQAVSQKEIGKYASCKIDVSYGKLHKICDIVEKPKHNQVFSLLAPLGRYILTSEVFDYIEKSPQKNGEVYLTYALQLMAKEFEIFAYVFDGERFDFGDKLGYMKGITKFALQDKNIGKEYLEFLKTIK